MGADIKNNFGFLWIWTQLRYASLIFRARGTASEPGYDVSNVARMAEAFSNTDLSG